VVGDRTVHGRRQLQAAVADELGKEVDGQHDLELVEPVVERRVLLDDRDVVVRIEADDALRAGLPPVQHVVLGHLVRDVDVARLPHGPAAAPLFPHEAELDASGPEEERDCARHRGAEEGRLAVGKEDRLAADRDVEPRRPGSHLALARLDVPAEDRLVAPAVGEVGPALPALLMDALLDRQRANRFYDVDRSLPEPVEVAREEGVRAAQLAGPAHRAVHVVLCDILHRQMALFHGNDVCVEGGRRVPLIAGHLHHRTDLAAELVA
jgi:hypothetical protein